MKKTIFDRLYPRLLILTLFFVFAEIGVQTNIYSFITPYKIFLGLLCILFLADIIRKPSTLPLSFRRFGSVFRAVLPVGTAILLYILFDLVSLTYTDQMNIALVKYVTIVSMSVIFFFVAGYITEDDGVSGDEKIEHLLFLFAAAATVLSILTWVYMIATGRTYYSRRMSMLADYNKFSSVVIFGYIATLYLLFRKEMPEKTRNRYLFFLSILMVPMIHLSGSRRNAKMLSAVIFFGLFYGFYRLLEKNNPGRLKQKLKFIVPMDLVTVAIYLLGGRIFKGLTPLIVVVLVAIQVKVLAGDGVKKYKKYILTVAGLLIVSQLIISGYNFATSIEARLIMAQNKEISNHVGSRDVETILDDEKALDKRETIWKISLKEYKNYSAKEKLIGKGASAHVDIFNKEENKALMERAYWKVIPDNLMDPHNALFVDLLNGGIVKAAITVVMLFSALILILRQWKYNPVDTWFLLLMAAVLFGDLMIGERDGILNNKFIWGLLFLLAAVAVNNKRKETV